MNGRRAILTSLVFATLALPALAAPARYPVSAGTVASVIQGMGLAVRPEQVELLSNVVASTPTPKLRVQSMQTWGDHRMMVRLECESPEECVPFFVGIAVNGQDQERLSASAAEIPQLARKSPFKSYAVRAGSQATLLLDGDHVHIRIPVICLENGAAGQTVRVTGRDRKQVYTAEVIDGSLLKGRL